MQHEEYLPRIKNELSAIESSYYRLILLVGPSGSGKTLLLQALQTKTGIPLINVNLELSKKLLDLTWRQRTLQTPKLLEEIVASTQNQTVALDNCEVLFDVNLKQDPLRLFQNISRNKTIISSWNGSVDKEYLFYAEPGHPEYLRSSAQGIRIIPMQEATIS